MTRTAPGLTLLVLLALPPAPPAASGAQPGDAAAIERAIHASIGWALTKDRPLLESVLAHDPGFFIFHPDSKSTVAGWEPMEKLFRLWMDPRFKALRYEIRDLRVNRSRAGDVAWWSAILDDCGAWDGTPSCWNDARWTGVLEKRDGTWVIVQMHFSFARDPRPPAQAAESGAAR